MDRKFAADNLFFCSRIADDINVADMVFAAFADLEFDRNFAVGEVGAFHRFHTQIRISVGIIQRSDGFDSGVLFFQRVNFAAFEHYLPFDDLIFDDIVSGNRDLVNGVRFAFFKNKVQIDKLRIIGSLGDLHIFDFEIEETFVVIQFAQSCPVGIKLLAVEHSLIEMVVDKRNDVPQTVPVEKHLTQFTRRVRGVALEGDIIDFQTEIFFDFQCNGHSAFAVGLNFRRGMRTSV